MEFLIITISFAQQYCALNQTQRERERGEEEEKEKEETSEETGGEERRVYDPQVVASIVIRWGPLVG